MRARGFLAWRELVPSAEFEKTLSKVLDDCFPNGDLHSYLEFGVSRGTSLADASDGAMPYVRSHSWRTRTNSNIRA